VIGTERPTHGPFLAPRRWGHRVRALALVALGAGLLAACGGPSATVLNNSAIPANLQLKQNNSNVAQSLAKVFNQTYPECTGTYAVFTLHGRAPTPALSGKTIYPQVYSESANCPSAASAQKSFQGVVTKVKSFGAKSLSGIGDGAILAASNTAAGKSYVIFWQDGATLASVQFSGPKSDKLLTEAETALLARRQIALQ
jgi:hypothetical protein